MKKLSGATKIIIGGVIVMGVFVFFVKQTASAFQPKSRATRQHKQGFLGGRYRGRSNYGGTSNQGGFDNLAGNRHQRKQQRRATRLMRRG